MRLLPLFPMLSPVQFDGQSRLLAVEVKHIRLQRMLPSEFEATDLAVPQQCPQ
jgi:hypothetical protein